jgi:hypothetical protein
MGLFSGLFSATKPAKPAQQHAGASVAAEVMDIINQEVVLAAFGLMPDDMPEVMMAEANLAPLAKQVVEAIAPRLRRARNPQQREAIIVEGLGIFTQMIREGLGNVVEYQLRIYGCAAHRLVMAGAAKVA